MLSNASLETSNILRQKEHIRDNLLQRYYAAIMESYFLFEYSMFLKMHCIVSPSSIYAFWLLLFWYLKTCLNNLKPSVICMIILFIYNYHLIKINWFSLSGICITSLIIDFICVTRRVTRVINVVPQLS
jgi:hypothetical protein